MAVRGYQILADWSRGGTYTGPLEDVSSRLLDEPELSWSYGRDPSEAAGTMPAGTARLALDNRDRALSPENVASPIAGLIEPGVPLVIRYARPIASDTFGRTATGGWGTADSGQAWSWSSGNSSHYSVSGGAGRHTLSGVGASRWTLLPLNEADGRIAVSMCTDAAPVGASHVLAAVARSTSDGATCYLARLEFTTSLGVVLTVRSRVSGTETEIASYTTGLAYTPGVPVAVTLEVWGTTVRARAWLASTVEPSGWQIEVTSSAVTAAGWWGTRSTLAPGNTNPLPVTALFSGLSVTWPQVTYYSGVIADAEVDTSHPANALVIDAVDLWGQLGSTSLSTPLHAGVRTGTAVGLILDAVGWTGGRDLDPGATVMPWWWAEGVTAADAMDALVDSEGPPAAAYVEGGTFCFRDRHFRVVRPVSRTVQGTYSQAIPAGSRPGELKILRNPGYDRGLKGIVNAAQFEVPERRPLDLSTVWSTDSTYIVGSGETVQVKVQTDDPFFGAITPESGIDYTLRSGAVDVWLSRTSGQGCTINVRGAGLPSQIDGLALRAFPVPVARTVTVTAEEGASVARHGRRVWERPVPHANAADAQAIAGLIASGYSARRPSVTITIAAVDTAHAVQVRDRRIGDRIRVVNDALGLDMHMIVQQVGHTVRKLGAIHRMTLGCVPAGDSYPADVFILGQSVLGVGVLAADELDDPTSVFILDQSMLGVGILGH